MGIDGRRHPQGESWSKPSRRSGRPHDGGGGGSSSGCLLLILAAFVALMAVVLS